jgi:hypothetical protein
MLSLRVDTLVCLTGVLLLLNFLLLVVDDFLLALSKCVTDEEFKEIREDDEQSLLLTRTRLLSKLDKFAFENAADPKAAARRLFSSFRTRSSVLFFSLLKLPPR